MSTEQKHTPEPWHVLRIHYRPEIRGPQESGEMIARTIERSDDIGGRDAEIANAERIVACVNAFEGVDTDAIALLPSGKVAHLLELATKFRDQVRDTCMRAEKAEADRDELLAAMRALMTDYENLAADYSAERERDGWDAYSADEELAAPRALLAKHGG